MKSKTKNILINIFLTFFVLSIFLDLHIFYNSFSTLIRAIFISILFMIVFFKYGKKQDRKYLYIYFFLFLIYIIAHLFNIPNSTIASEILYFYKISMNLLIIYIISKLDIKLDTFYKILNICILLISGQIVICNIFKIGYSSYGFFPIKHNIFEWFNGKEYYFAEISSNGFFQFGNQTSAIILLYLPLLINKLKNKIKVFDVITIIILLLSLLMLGTRIATIVPLMIIVISLMVYDFLLIIKKETFKPSFMGLMVLLIMGYSAILFSSPLMARYDFYDSLLNTTDKKNTGEENDKNSNEDQEEEDNEEIDIFKDRVINMSFPNEIYPYKNDPEFWQGLMKYDDNILSDTRFIENSVIKRVKELNNKPLLDNLLGIGYKRIIDMQNIEQDFVMHYYSIGIIGTILVLGVYILLYLYMLIKIFINMEDKLVFKNIMLLLGIGVVLTTSYYSGNLLNSISIIIPLGTIIGISLNEVRSKKEKDAKVLGFNVCTEEYNKLLTNIKNDLKNNKRNIIYNINPLIVMNFYKNEELKDKFNKQKYNIPDGIGTVMALKMKDISVPSRIAGVELFEDLLDIAVKDKYKVYLYGAKKEVVAKAKENIEKHYKNINIVGITSGYESEDKALANIKKAKPDMLFVATGSPKQEEFIINNEDKLKNVKLIMPVGGSFDVISGYTKRAPKVWQKLRLEWLYRMIKEPKRMKSNLNLLKFMFLVIFRNK